jgi:hypothetical protein
MLEHKIKLLSSENVDLKNEADQSLTASESILETYRSHSVGDQSSPDTPLNPDVQEAAISFAQLSLAHHGEYIGGGTVVSALHKVSTLPHPRLRLLTLSHFSSSAKIPCSSIRNQPTQ